MGIEFKTSEKIFREAVSSDSLEFFLKSVMPEEWSPISARILESGATYGSAETPWAPRWSPVPLTVKRGYSQFEADIKTTLYRLHDCIHQLWGLPIPHTYSTEEYYKYKRAQMCGEVAVLTIIEFLYAKWLIESHPDTEPLLFKRMAILMMQGPLKSKTPLQLAARLDTLLHKKVRAHWVRTHEPSIKFADYYEPMLEDDRKGIDHNWELMKNMLWCCPKGPNVRYPDHLDGLELTLWMVEDFFHLQSTSCEHDQDLATFNRQRRSQIILPDGWNKID